MIEAVRTNRMMDMTMCMVCAMCMLCRAENDPSVLS